MQFKSIFYESAFDLGDLFRCFFVKIYHNVYRIALFHINSMEFSVTSAAFHNVFLLMFLGHGNVQRKRAFLSFEHCEVI